jgi:hypothetical protein
LANKVATAEIAHGVGVSKIRGLLKPLNGFREVFGYTLARIIIEAYHARGCRITSVRLFLEFGKLATVY